MSYKKWFRPLGHGFWRSPVSWQGWTSTIAYIALLIIQFRVADRYSDSASDTLIGFSIPFLLTTTLFIFLVHGTSESDSEKNDGGDKD